MGIFIGGNEIKDIKIGSTAINSVWIGANKVWNRALDTQTVTVGNYYDYFWGSTHWGDYGNAGSTSDGTCNFKSNATISSLAWSTSDPLLQAPLVRFYLDGTHSNGGFTTMTVENTGFARTNASFFSISGSSFWLWASTSNPFGTTVGATKTVTWT